MMRLLYVFYLVLFFIPVFLILTACTAVITISGCLLGGDKLFSYYPGMIWARLTCYLALCPVKVKGREYITKNQSYVFVSNHQGAFDIFLIYGFLGVPVKWVMKASLGKIPFIGSACRAAGFVFVDSTTAKSAAKTLGDVNKLLKNGASVVVFPEASRTYDGKMVRFKKGAFQMAIEQPLPVIPITLNGPYDILPINSIKMRPHKMEMIIHPAISTHQIESSHKGMQQLTDQAQGIIASALWEKYK